MAAAPDSTYGPWFAEPPVVGSTTGKYTVVYATGAKAKQLAANHNAGFRTKAEADAYATQQDSVFALSGNPVTAAGQVITGNTTAAGAAGNPLSGLAAIGDFFGRLTQSNTWIRIAKVVIGGVLLMTGIAHITGASGAAFDAARKVPLPV